MNKLPKKFVERVGAQVKKYQKIAETQQKADSAEADTVTLVKDILADIFGYDTYEELTSEHQIKAVYCDLAIKICGELQPDGFHSATTAASLAAMRTPLATNYVPTPIDAASRNSRHYSVSPEGELLVDFRCNKINVAE